MCMGKIIDCSIFIIIFGIGILIVNMSIWFWLYYVMRNYSIWMSMFMVFCINKRIDIMGVIIYFIVFRIICSEI